MAHRLPTLASVMLALLSVLLLASCAGSDGQMRRGLYIKDGRKVVAK